MATKLPDVLTPKQVADYLQLGRDKTYQMLRSGELPSVRLGRTYRIQRLALDDWLARRAAESLTS